MNALSEFAGQLKTGKDAALFIVSMVAHSRGNAAGNKRKFAGIMVEWLYKFDEAGIIIPIEKIKMSKAESGLIF